MFTGILDAVKEGLALANKILQRKWGDQTSDEASLRKQAEQAALKKKEAYRLWMDAQRKHDQDHINQYHSAYNGWSAELQRLQDEAAAKRQ